MQKRRERIEQWRAERKPKLELPPVQIAPPSRKWTLEDEDDDDEDDGADESKENGAEPDIDSLDAYMKVGIISSILSKHLIVFHTDVAVVRLVS